MKRNNLILLLYLLACLSISCTNKIPEENGKSSFEILTSSLTFVYGSGTVSQQIEVKKSGDVKSIEWSSDNDKVASVSQSGMVTAKGLGVTNINAQLGDIRQTVPVSVISQRSGHAVLFSGAEMMGTAIELGKGEYSDVQFNIASLSIPDGLRIKLYRDEKSGGGYLGLEESQNDLRKSGWYDNIVKVIVEDYIEDEPAVKNYNYVLGTQIFSPRYGLTGNNKNEWSYDAAKEIYKMGSNVLKTYGKSIESTIDYKIMLQDNDFQYIYLWVEFGNRFHPNPQWGDDLQIEYDRMYDFVSDILVDYNNTGKSFYLGHWEGDWLLLEGTDSSKKKVGDDNIQGMTDWLNIRQKAIDDAKAATPHTNVNLWQYTEANRTTDISNGSERVVNSVLPNTTVDYLSYSAYDIQGLPGSMVKSHIDYMDGMIPSKSSVPNPGKRIIIGEMGLPTNFFEYDQHIHNRDNIGKIISFFDADVMQILYWEMYANDAGHYLIDDNGVKWKLYYSYKAFYCNAKEYVREYIATHDKTPEAEDFNAWASDFLKTLR